MRIKARISVGTGPRWYSSLIILLILFRFASYMTYKGFKSKVRELARIIGAKEVTVAEDEGQQAIGCLSYWSCERDILVVLFRTEIEVPDGQRRQFNVYDPRELFK